MYIQTSNGNFVPASAVKVIKPDSAGGSVVHLMSGDRFKDERDPVTLLESIAPKPSDDAVISSVLDQLKCLAQDLADTRNDVSVAISKVTSHTNRAINELQQQVLDFGNVEEGMRRTASRLETKANTVASQVSNIKSLVGELNDILQEEEDYQTDKRVPTDSEHIATR